MPESKTSKSPLSTRRQFLVSLGIAGTSAAVSIPIIQWLLSDRSTPPPSGLQQFMKRGNALGTEVSIIALHEDRQVLERAIQSAFEDLEKIESIMSIYRPVSQISDLNRRGRLDHPHPWFFEVVERGMSLSKATGGAFDLSVQPLWALYAGAKKRGALPTESEIRLTRRRVDWRKIEVERDRIRFRGADMAITLNGIAQGFATDQVRKRLAAHGIQHALIDTGEFGAVGRNRKGEPWKVGIQHPRVKDSHISRAFLDNRCIATSGDYATTFSDDRKAHHIFDPRTGHSPTSFQSVTVMADSGLEADALSTAIFVLGIEKGMGLIEGTSGADALFVLKDGRVKATRNFPRVGAS